MTLKWQRPENSGYPSVWKLFEGKISEEGKVNKYRIQDVTEDLEEDVVQHMVQYFLIREPTMSSLGIVSEETSRKETIQCWRECLKQKMCLVCLVEEEFGKWKVAGVNMTYVTSKEDPILQFTGALLNKEFTMMSDLANRGDIFNRHNVTEYLTAFGLSCCPMYSGDDVGYQLLMARDDLCRKTGIKVTGTVFIAAGQHVALKAGFKVVAETDLREYKANGYVAFPRCNPKKLVFAEKVMT